MKPRMRAFSGRVTLLAVLNISCAANICSLCRAAGRGVSVGAAAQVLLPSTTGTPTAGHTYREGQILLGLLLGRGLSLWGHHGHWRCLGSGGDSWGCGGRQR